MGTTCVNVKTWVTRIVDTKVDAGSWVVMTWVDPGSVLIMVWPGRVRVLNTTLVTVEAGNCVVKVVTTPGSVIVLSMVDAGS